MRGKENCTCILRYEIKTGGENFKYSIVVQIGEIG
jgi:hypothetical protein